MKTIYRALRMARPGVLALALISATGLARAEDAAPPPVIKALESRGLMITKEFKAGDGLRAFAGVANNQPVAAYVTRDGNAIIGIRVGPDGKPLDEAALQASAAKPVSDNAWSQLAATDWVLDGKAQAPRIVYLFADADCIYCHRFWEAARPWVDSGKVQMREILVGIIDKDSPAKAAAILGAADPSAALLENEKNFGQGGIAPAKRIPADVEKKLASNLKLMLSMGFQGTPGIVVLDGNGLVRKYNGMPQQSALADVLGPR